MTRRERDKTNDGHESSAPRRTLRLCARSVPSPVWAAAAVLWSAAPGHAQRPAIVSFRDAGGLTWSNSTPGVTCRVEWASSPDGPWTNTWAGLNAIATGTNPLVTVRVPFYYRVACPPIHRTVDAPAAGRLVRSNIGNPRFVVIDVRTAAEFAPAHIRGATNIDYYAVDFAQQVGRLDREKGYLLYCRSGARSSGAFNLMKGMGFVELYAMSVGFSVFAAVPGHTDLVE